MDTPSTFHAGDELGATDIMHRMERFAETRGANWVSGLTPSLDRIGDPMAWAERLRTLNTPRALLMTSVIGLFAAPKHDPQTRQIVVSDAFLRAIVQWVGDACFTDDAVFDERDAARKSQGSDAEYAYDDVAYALAAARSGPTGSVCHRRAAFLRTLWPLPCFQPFRVEGVTAAEELVRRSAWYNGILVTLPPPKTSADAAHGAPEIGEFPDGTLLLYYVASPSEMGSASKPALTTPAAPAAPAAPKATLPKRERGWTLDAMVLYATEMMMR